MTSPRCLYDPYVTFLPSERAELIDFYLGLGNRNDLGATRAQFDEIYRLCAVQRLMQALGAYGFLGLVKGKDSFSGLRPHCAGVLREVAWSRWRNCAMAGAEGLDEFGAMLAGLPL